MKKIKVIPLGGVEQIGINCTLLESQNKIIILDAGLGFSEVDHLGVDYLIPNYDYLVKNKSKIEGIFITHGHLDHIGALQYFLPKLDFPDLFAPRFALELIKNKLEEAGLITQMKGKLHEVGDETNLNNGVFTIQYFRVNHSIPDSFGLIIKTEVGTIVHTGDFKFDHSPLNEPKTDYYKMTQVAKDGVKLLLSDSTNSYREGHSISERQIMKRLSSVIRAAKGRVVVATFSSLVTRLYALVEIAKQENRKIFVTGRSMQNSIDIARKLNYINAPKDLFIDAKSVNRYSDNNLLILSTGSQGEDMSALARMSRGEHRDINLKTGDTVILSSSVIPGNNAYVQKLIDEISQLGAEVIHQEIMNLHTSGHGFIEDQKLMINIIQPDLFMPVHGVQYFLTKHAKTAQDLGIKKQDCIIPQRGDVIEITKDSWRKTGKIKNNPLLVSGNAVGDVGPKVLEDREQLAENGVLSITLVVEKKANEKNYSLAFDPKIYSRGFVYVQENKDLLAEIKEKTKKVFLQNNHQTKIEHKLRFEIEKHVGGMIYAYTKKNPLLTIEIVNISR